MSELLSSADRQLIGECLLGNPVAWEAFVERFAGLFAFVIDRTAEQWGKPLTASDRDDLLAESLLEILDRDAAVLRSFRGTSSLSTYLAVVVRRIAVRGLVRLSDRRRIAAGTAADAARVTRVDNGPTHLDDRDQIETMLAGLARSDPKGAEILRLHHLKGHSYGEISRMTGMPLGSIGPTLARARQKMRERAE
jgi:RNA polymerase sigma-70 factor (ECF subfamily)